VVKLDPNDLPHALQLHIPCGNQATCRQATAAIVQIYNTVEIDAP
jgi:hypothetical protein